MIRDLLHCVRAGVVEGGRGVPGRVVIPQDVETCEEEVPVTGRLKERLQDGLRGILPHGTHEDLHQDALTHLLRQQEQLKIHEGFLQYLDGWMKGLDSVVMEASTICPLKARLGAARNDLKRSRDPNRKGCCGARR